MSQTNISTPAAKSKVCPKCGSNELTYLTKRPRTLIVKILMDMLIVLSIGSIAANFGEDHQADQARIIVAIVFLVLALILHIIVYVIERARRPRAICRNCGHIWLLK